MAEEKAATMVAWRAQQTVGQKAATKAVETDPSLAEHSVVWKAALMAAMKAAAKDPSLVDQWVEWKAGKMVETKAVMRAALMARQTVGQKAAAKAV